MNVDAKLKTNVMASIEAKHQLLEDVSTRARFEAAVEQVIACYRHAAHAIPPGTARTLAKREPGRYT